MNAWNPMLLEVKALVEAWHLQHTGRRVDFNVCLLNRYQDGNQSLGWHGESVGQLIATYPLINFTLEAVA